MSMTIDLPLRTVTVIRVAMIALVAWFGAILAVTALLGPTREVLILARNLPAAFSALVATDGAFVGSLGPAVIMRSEAPDVVPRLYGAGAWIVLPIRVRGCNSIVPLAENRRSTTS